MAQPAVLNHDESSDLLGVPNFWPRPTPEPPFNWDTWIGQFFLATTLREHCDPNVLLSEPAENFDDPPPKAEREGESESVTLAENRIKRDQAEVRKTNEQNADRRKKGPKIGPNIYSHQADPRVKSRLFFSLGTEGKKRFFQNFVHVNLATTKFKDFFEQCTNLFKKDKKFVVERKHLYNSSQKDREGLEGFFLRLSGQAA